MVQIDKNTVAVKDQLKPNEAVTFERLEGNGLRVMFVGNSERIEIKHQAHSREVFVGGAVLAAKWVVSQKKGVVYAMSDVLE